MRRWGTVLPMLLCLALTGCLTGDSIRSSNWLDRMRSPRLPLGPDGILIDLVLLERPLADKYINEEVWEKTDWHIVGFDRHELLAENGLRVGQVVGLTPGKLQNLLSTERYAVSRRRQILATGQSTSIALTAPIPMCSFRLSTSDGPAEVALDQGQPTLLIEPVLADHQCVRLKFTPQVLYGTTMPHHQVAADKSGWLLQYRRPTKTYSALSWEATLAPNQYLVVGTCYDEEAGDDKLQTLGGQFFIQETPSGWVQRLLVVRTARGEEPINNAYRVASGQNSENTEQPTSAAAHCVMSPGH